MKKGKKARRREREEEAERALRIEAWRARQRERAERLGIIATTTTTEEEGAVIEDGTRIKAEGGGGGGEMIRQRRGGGDVRPCNTCGGAFTPGEYRLHFRSNWHGYNVKLKMRGVPPVSETEFSLCDSDAFLSST